MQPLTPSTRLYQCQQIVRHNDDITLTYHKTLVRATQDFFIAHHNGGAECEGIISHPHSLHGRRIHIDLFRDRSRGVFSIEGTAVLIPASYFSVSIVWETSRRVSCHLTKHGHYSDQLLEMYTEQGIFYGKRNHEQRWGPRVFRCLVGRHGPATVYVP